MKYACGIAFHHKNVAGHCDTEFAAVVLNGLYANGEGKRGNKVVWEKDPLRGQLYTVARAEAIASYFPGALVEYEDLVIA